MNLRSLSALALLLPAAARAQGTTRNNLPLWSWFGGCALQQTGGLRMLASLANIGLARS